MRRHIWNVSESFGVFTHGEETLTHHPLSPRPHRKGLSSCRVMFVLCRPVVTKATEWTWPRLRRTPRQVFGRR